MLKPFFFASTVLLKDPKLSTLDKKKNFVDGKIL